MNHQESVLCTICARGGSKGVPDKNIKEIGGKPLIAWTIEAAIKAGIFSHIVVSSDSEEIMKISEKWGAEVFFKRPLELSGDNSPKLAVIKHAHNEACSHFGQIFDYHVDLDATSPLRISEDIVNSFDFFLQNNFDNLITAMPSRRSPYFNMVKVIDGKAVLCQNSDIIRRQDAPETFDMNASIYIWKREALLNSEKVISDNTGLFVMPEERSIDIDSKFDWEIVEFLLKRRSNAQK